MKTIPDEEIGDFFEAPEDEKPETRKKAAVKAAAKKVARKMRKRSGKPKTKVVVVNIKMDLETHETLVKKAKRNARGNLSAWLRHSGMRYVPKPGERVKKVA